MNGRHIVANTSKEAIAALIVAAQDVERDASISHGLRVSLGRLFATSIDRTEVSVEH